MKQKIEVGDRIKFAAPTRCGAPVATRVVNGFWGATRSPTVRFHGYSDFMVRDHEIISIEKRANK